jgi:hypothetical protein
MPRQEEIEPYSPGRACPACSAEAGKPRYHASPILITFGRGPRWPCSDMAPETGPHMCTRCESCGYAWTEDILPGMDATAPG